MKRRSSLALLALVAPLCLAGDESWGRWQDSDGTNVYEFLPANEFQFTGTQRTYVKRSGLAGGLIAEWKTPRGQYVPERRSIVGAWESGDNICSVTVPGQPEEKGNLRIFVDTVVCCMEARRLGPTLVLRALDPSREVQEKVQTHVCLNRSLRRTPG